MAVSVVLGALCAAAVAEDRIAARHLARPSSSQLPASFIRPTLTPSLLSGLTVPSQSRSLGYTWRGRLAAGVHLPQGGALRLVDEYVAANRFWGTQRLVRMIAAVAGRTARRHPGGGRLGVGELSQRLGGPIPGHRSHQSGRDVDLAFYATDAFGAAVEVPTFVNFNRRGHAQWKEQPILFDHQRNWTLVESLVLYREAPVQIALVAGSIKRRLLNYAKHAGVSPVIINRARKVLVTPPPGMHPHRNHFHVRVYCATHELPSCRDKPPYWPWIVDPRRPLRVAMR